MRKITRKMTDANPAASVLCEPAQSKYTWTCRKRHSGRKFTGKMPKAPDATSMEHRALTVTVRTPQCGHTVWGTKTNLKVPKIQKQTQITHTAGPTNTECRSDLASVQA